MRNFYFSVGGIYTVIRSKAYVSTEEMGDQYCMVGPYKELCARTEVEEADYPTHTPLYKAVQVMRDQGYKVCAWKKIYTIQNFRISLESDRI